MKVSFVIPAYNAAKTVCRCLDSVIAQTDGEWEAVVIDDGSSDNTYELISSYAEKDCRIIALTQENQGPGLTRNNAMARATGDYVAFLDSDDYVEKDYLALVKEKIEREELDVVVIDNFYETPDGRLIRMERLSRFAGLCTEELIAVQMTGKMPWGGWRKVVRADLIKKNGIEYSKDAVGEEAVFSFNVFYHASRIGFLGAPVLHYVDYPTSQSKKGNDDPWGPVVDRLLAHLEKNGLLTQYQRPLNSFAYTALAVSAYRISKNHRFFEAVSLVSGKIKETKQKYKCRCDRACLERRVRLLMPLIRANLAFLIVLAARLFGGKALK